MKQDKQTENDARLFFDDILQKTNPEFERFSVKKRREA